MQPKKAFRKRKMRERSLRWERTSWCLNTRSQVQGWLVLGGGAIAGAVRAEIIQRLQGKVRGLAFILPAMESFQKVLSRRVA